MAVGDLTSSVPVYRDFNDATGIKAVIDALNLAATTDFIFVIPAGDGKQVMIFQVERATA